MKQSKEQIEAYRTMAKQAPQSMNDIIKQHLTENCPKFKENEDKFDRCIKHLYETVLEILGGRDAADDDNTLSGQVPADTVFQICRDYFDDELWKKEDEEAAKEKAENEKRAEAIRQKDAERKRKAEEKKKKEIEEKAVKDSDLFKDNNNKPSTPEPYEYEEKDDDEDDDDSVAVASEAKPEPVKPAEPVKPKPAQLDMFAMFGGK